MFKLIVGVNDREEALDALRLAREIAGFEQGKVIAAAAFIYDYPHLGLAFPEARAAFYEKTRKRAEIALGDLEYEHVELQDSPAHGIQRLAEDESADLIVVGSTHRGPIGRVLPGSVGEILLSGGPCPVAVAPRGYARGDHSKLGVIGVGYDGFNESKLALTEAVRIARKADADLRIISVAPALTTLRPGPVAPMRDLFRERVEQGIASVPDDVDADGAYAEGDPADELAANAGDLDLLVLGSRGYGPLRHVLLGSVANKAIRMAPCPVLVVPRGTEDRVREHAAEAAGATA
jgi:nucleotide-binding universal stress UspA family protein